MTDLAVLRDMGLYLGGGGGIVYLLYRVVMRVASKEMADTAGYNSTAASIERLEKHLREADERTRLATERADKAERERNEALVQIAQLTFTVNSLRDEVKSLRDEVVTLRKTGEGNAGRGS